MLFGWLTKRKNDPRSHGEIARQTLNKNAQSAIKLVLEISYCWNEAKKEAKRFSADDQDEQFAILFRDNFYERALVPMQKIFDKLNKDIITEFGPQPSCPEKVERPLS